MIRRFALNQGQFGPRTSPCRSAAFGRAPGPAFRGEAALHRESITAALGPASRHRRSGGATRLPPATRRASRRRRIVWTERESITAALGPATRHRRSGGATRLAPGAEHGGAGDVWTTSPANRAVFGKHQCFPHRLWSTTALVRDALLKTF